MPAHTTLVQACAPPAVRLAFRVLQTLAVQQTTLLFDDLIGASKKQLWDREAERLGGLEIDDQFEFRGLLDRQIGRLLALENPAGVNADLTVLTSKTASVAHQAAGRRELVIREDRGHQVAERIRSKQLTLNKEISISR